MDVDMKQRKQTAAILMHRRMKAPAILPMPWYHEGAAQE
jgi:hypothetical protein